MATDIGPPSLIPSILAGRRIYTAYVAGLSRAGRVSVAGEAEHHLDQREVRLEQPAGVHVGHVLGLPVALPELGVGHAGVDGGAVPAGSPREQQGLVRPGAP